MKNPYGTEILSYRDKPDLTFVYVILLAILMGFIALFPLLFRLALILYVAAGVS